MSVGAQTGNFDTRNMRQYAATMDYIVPGLKDVVFSLSPSLAIFASQSLGDFGGVRMKGSGHRTASGYQVVTRIRLGTHAGAKRAASDFDTHNVAPDDNVRFAEWPWKYYNHGCAISAHDLAINQGDAAIASFLEDQTKSTLLSIADLIATDLHQTVSPANAFTSLDDLISANDTAGGLSGANFTKWNARGLSARGTAVGSISFTSGSFAAQGLSDMRKAYNNASEGMIQPDAIITEYDTHQRYEGVLQPSERFQGAVAVADGSFQALAFRGKPVMADPYCASGAMYFLRSGDEGINFYCLTGMDFTWGEWKPSANQPVMVRPLLVTCALVINNRAYGANKLTGITD